MKNFYIKKSKQEFLFEKKNYPEKKNNQKKNKNKIC